MDARRVAGEDSEDSYTREEDSIPLADGDPADVVEDSLISEDRRKVTTYQTRSPTFKLQNSRAG